MPKLQFIMERQTPCRLDTFLRKECGVSARQLSHLRHCEGGILCNGRQIRTIDTVQPGDCILLNIEDVPNIPPNPQLYAPLLFEDDDLLLFDKPAGMPVHPSQHHRMDTLGNVFAAMYPHLTYRPVHRLDQDTSGITAVAKHPIAAARLHGQMQKIYYAFCEGILPASGTISAPIGRVEGSVILRQVSENGKYAVTHYERLQTYDTHSLARIRLETGRTHQIRVHFSHIGHPLAGDDLYGGSLEKISRHALHCGEVFYTDIDGILHRICSPLPEDIRRLTGADQNLL